MRFEQDRESWKVGDECKAQVSHGSFHYPGRVVRVVHDATDHAPPFVTVTVRIHDPVLDRTYAGPSVVAFLWRP